MENHPKKKDIIDIRKQNAIESNNLIKQASINKINMLKKV